MQPLPTPISGGGAIDQDVVSGGGGGIDRDVVSGGGGDRISDNMEIMQK